MKAGVVRRAHSGDSIVRSLTSLQSPPLTSATPGHTLGTHTCTCPHVDRQQGGWAGAVQVACLACRAVSRPSCPHRPVASLCARFLCLVWA